MENLIWAILLWALVFILIPLNRVKEIWPAAVIAMVLGFIMNYIFIQWGYWRFTHYFVLLAGVPPFHVLGIGAGGILVVNWIQRDILNKLTVVVFSSVLMTLAELVMIGLNAYEFLKGFNYILAFIRNVAGLSFLVWFSIMLIGQERIYGGEKSRFSIR